MLQLHLQSFRPNFVSNITFSIIIHILCSLIIATNCMTVEPEESFHGHLRSQLSFYDLLDPGKIISKRSLGDDSTQQLHIRAFNRTYILVLHQSYSGTAPASLTIQTVSPEGTVRSTKAADLLSEFYSGYVEGEPNSYVHGFKEGKKFHLTVDDGEQLLNIEPLSVISRNQSDNRLLAYYDDAINNTGHFCGSLSAEAGANVQTSPAPSSSASTFFDVGADKSAKSKLRRRQRREAQQQQPQSVCRMQLVADYTFVERIASGSFGGTAKSLIKIADDINKVYMDTTFVHPTTGEVFVNVGFELANVVVLVSPSQDGPSWAPHFNAPLREGAPPQHASQYLEAFGDSEQNGINLAAYCINHLVTFRPMQQNILGLAYLGSSYPSNIGGVCSQPSPSNHGRQRTIGRNIGMATYANKDGQPILSRQALLVSAHELGHNLGSEHDPVSQSVCSPSWSEGGPYLMYQIAVSGSVRHHSMFSECSSKQIAMVISARKSSCFHAATNKLCGNHRREPGEQCDPGPTEDKCCTADCRLRRGAKCSDANSPCCRGCQFANSSTMCQKQSLLNPCQENTYCSGLNDTCPKPTDLTDNTSCNFGVGFCLAGRCESVCSQLGPASKPCACETEQHACHVCCRDGAGNCTVYRQLSAVGSVVLMPANQPCRRGPDRIQGHCDSNATCVEQPRGSGQLIVRLWDLIVQSGSSSVATFLWKNIVFTVVILSLLLWVPACSIIAYQDRLDARKSAAGSDSDPAGIGFAPSAKLAASGPARSGDSYYS